MKQYRDKDTITKSEGLAMYTDLIKAAQAGNEAAKAQVLDLLEAKDRIFAEAYKKAKARGII